MKRIKFLGSSCALAFFMIFQISGCSLFAPKVALQKVIVDVEPRANNDTPLPLDFVAVAEEFLHAPYLWGGKTSLGLDCSGLVQVALQAAGHACPRDSDMQEMALGKLSSLGDLRRGDLVFWKGHVAMARDGKTLLHANAYAMAVAIENATEAIARIKAAGSEVTSVKRI